MYTLRARCSIYFYTQSTALLIVLIFIPYLFYVSRIVSSHKIRVYLLNLSSTSLDSLSLGLARKLAF
jgi:hypothetical protein